MNALRHFTRAGLKSALQWENYQTNPFADTINCSACPFGEVAPPRRATNQFGSAFCISVFKTQRQ